MVFTIVNTIITIVLFEKTVPSQTTAKTQLSLIVGIKNKQTKKKQYKSPIPQLLCFVSGQTALVNLCVEMTAAELPGHSFYR